MSTTRSIGKAKAKNHPTKGLGTTGTGARNGAPAKPREPELFDEVMAPFMDHLSIIGDAAKCARGGIRGMVDDIASIAQKMKPQLSESQFAHLQAFCVKFLKEYVCVERFAAVIVERVDRIFNPMGHLFLIAANEPEKLAELLEQLSRKDYHEKHPRAGRVTPLCMCQFCVDERREQDSFEARFREAMGASLKGDKNED